MRKQPTERGWYWVKTANEPIPVLVIEMDGKLHIAGSPFAVAVERIPDSDWLGKAKPPEDPDG